MSLKYVLRIMVSKLKSSPSGRSSLVHHSLIAVGLIYAAVTQLIMLSSHQHFPVVPVEEKTTMALKLWQSAPYSLYKTEK